MTNRFIYYFLSTLYITLRILANKKVSFSTLSTIFSIQISTDFKKNIIFHFFYCFLKPFREKREREMILKKEKRKKDKLKCLPKSI